MQADVTASFDGSYSGTVEYGVTCDKNNAGGTFGCEKLSSHTGGFDHTSTFSGTETSCELGAQNCKISNRGNS